MIFLQIFGGAEDTHKTLPVKKASQKTEKKKEEEKKEDEDDDDEEEGDREEDDRRSSSVYDSRSSLRRWVNSTILTSSHIGDAHWLEMIRRR